jgi:nucleotide-binding universal stress UspA family protein
METPERLIVPLDGSTTAEQAMPVAQSLAESLNLPIRAIHVYDTIRELGAVTLGEIEWSSDADPRAVTRPPAFMRDVIERTREAGVDVEVIGRVGKPAEEICKELRETDRPWTVMSSLGQGGMRRLFLGSTSRQIIRTTESPVLLISDGSERIVRSSEINDRICVLLDGTRQSESAVCHAATLASGAGLELELLRVAETFRDDGEPVSQEESNWESEVHAEGARYLADFAEVCGDLQIPIRQTVLSGSPLVQIVRHIKEVNPRFVALATRRRSGIERWTYGSVAEKIVDSVPIPLLLVPVADQ